MNEIFVNKLKLLSDLFKCVNDLSEMRVNVNSVSVKTSENVLNIWDNNCGKMCRISTECKERIEMNVKYEYVRHSHGWATGHGPTRGLGSVILD